MSPIHQHLLFLFHTDVTLYLHIKLQSRRPVPCEKFNFPCFSCVITHYPLLTYVTHHAKGFPGHLDVA